MITAQSGLYIRPSGAPAPVPVPLLGVSIAAEVVGTSLAVELAQRFKNVETQPIEAVYLFPLPTDAAVSGFVAEVDGRRVEGRVEERDKAFEIYDDAMADGHGAFLMDQERPNVFTLSVGNLKPASEVVVRLRWVQTIVWEGDSLRLTLPTTVSPRYTPAGGPIEVGQPDADKLAAERLATVPYGLSLKVAIADAIQRIESPTHPIRTSLQPCIVELSQVDVALDRDVVILITPAAPQVPVAHVATYGADRYAQVQFVPDMAATDDAGAEVIFVVDCSGSMQGDSINEARRALELCVRALDQRDRFDIVRFGSTHTSLFGHARAYDQQALDAAVAYVRATDAELGGTEILAPLKHIVERPLEAGRMRQVLLLTDGQVSNEAEVIELAKQHAQHARIFAFGIGAGVSEHLVREVARASHGEVEMIAPGERIEPKVLRQFGRVRSPALHDVKVDWGGLEVEQAPRVVPPVFKGEPLTVWAKVRGGTAAEGGRATVTLRAGSQSWSVPIDLERATSGGPVPQLWGRAAIRDIESDSGRHGSSQQRPGKEDRKQSRLVELGKALGLVSSATSYVAVEVRSEADKTSDAAVLRRVPIALTHGWGGGGALARAIGSGARHSIASVAPSGPPQRAMPAPFAAAAPPSAPSRAKSGGVMKRLARMLTRDEADAGAAESYAAPEPQPESKDQMDALYTLLLTQAADGSFPFAAIRGFVNDTRAFDILMDMHGEPQLCTAVALAVLARDYGDRQAEWKPAADKARRFLGSFSLDVKSLI